MGMIKTDLFFAQALAYVPDDSEQLQLTRPEPRRSASVAQRIRAAWMVLTGRANAVPSARKMGDGQ